MHVQYKKWFQEFIKGYRTYLSGIHEDSDKCLLKSFPSLLTLFLYFLNFSILVSIIVYNFC